MSSTLFADDEVLLPADQAFEFRAQMVSPNRIDATWRIADGYYMYRDKFDFRFTGNNIITAQVSLPVGTPKEDSIFGKVQVYTQSLEVAIPILPNGAREFQLIASGQGCNEPVGVCYPPMEKTVRFSQNGQEEETPKAPSFFQSGTMVPNSPGPSDDLRDQLAAGFQPPEFLDVDDAFRLRIEATSRDALHAVFTIAEGYYLYRDKIHFSSESSPQIKPVVLPDGKDKVDEYFGEVVIFDQDFSALVELETLLTDENRFVLSTSYQGCAVDGICYAPVTKTFDFSSLFTVLSFDANAQSTPVFTAEFVGGQSAAPTSPQPSSNDVQANLNDAGSKAAKLKTETDIPTRTVFLFFSAMIAGLLLTFTPCVLPMIPVLTSIIAGQGKHLTSAKGGVLAIFYVVGTMITYAAMGALAGATGDQLQAYFQNIWAIGFLSVLFFIMALSMFGLFDIQMPAFIQARLQFQPTRMRGPIPLVLCLGILSALIIGACVSPVLISFLGIAVSTGDPFLGALLMTAMALGMGIPLIALGFGAGHLVPRAGQWMVKVKQGFGVLLVATAIYLLGILPQVPVLLLWGGFFILLSVFLGAVEKSGETAGNWQRFEKGVGILLLVWGIVLLLGGFLGQRDLFRPLPQDLFARFSQSVVENTEMASHPFTRVTNTAQLDQMLATAKREKKSVLVDYYADWCVDCLRMEETTFKDAAIDSLLREKFVTIQIDVTDATNQDNRLLKQYFGVFGPPATIFLDRDGNILEEKNFYGYMDSDRFLQLISGFQP